jgi:hypothetical protein
MDHVPNHGASGRLPTLFDIVEGRTEGQGDAVWWGALTLMDPPSCRRYDEVAAAHRHR